MYRLLDSKLTNSNDIKWLVISVGCSFFQNYYKYGYQDLIAKGPHVLGDAIPITQAKASRNIASDVSNFSLLTSLYILYILSTWWKLLLACYVNDYKNIFSHIALSVLDGSVLRAKGFCWQSHQRISCQSHSIAFISFFTTEEPVIVSSSGNDWLLVQEIKKLWGKKWEQVIAQHRQNWILCHISYPNSSSLITCMYSFVQTYNSNFQKFMIFSFLVQTEGLAVMHGYNPAIPVQA